MSVLTMPHLGARFRPTLVAFAHLFTTAAQRISAAPPTERPVRRDRPSRGGYLEDSLMSREMGRL